MMSHYSTMAGGRYSADDAPSDQAREGRDARQSPQMSQECLQLWDALDTNLCEERTPFTDIMRDSRVKRNLGLASASKPQAATAVPATTSSSSSNSTGSPVKPEPATNSSCGHPWSNQLMTQLRGLLGTLDKLKLLSKSETTAEGILANRASNLEAGITDLLKRHGQAVKQASSIRPGGEPTQAAQSHSQLATEVWKGCRTLLTERLWVRQLASMTCCREGCRAGAQATKASPHKVLVAKVAAQEPLARSTGRIRIPVDIEDDEEEDQVVEGIVVAPEVIPCQEQADAAQQEAAIPVAEPTPSPAGNALLSESSETPALVSPASTEEDPAGTSHGNILTSGFTAPCSPGSAATAPQIIPIHTSPQGDHVPAHDGAVAEPEEMPQEAEAVQGTITSNDCQVLNLADNDKTTAQVPVLQRPSSSYGRQLALGIAVRLPSIQPVRGLGLAPFKPRGSRVPWLHHLRHQVPVVPKPLTLPTNVTITPEDPGSYSPAPQPEATMASILHDSNGTAPTAPSVAHKPSTVQRPKVPATRQQQGMKLRRPPIKVSGLRCVRQRKQANKRAAVLAKILATLPGAYQALCCWVWAPAVAQAQRRKMMERRNRRQAIPFPAGPPATGTALQSMAAVVAEEPTAAVVAEEPMAAPAPPPAVAAPEECGVTSATTDCKNSEVAESLNPPVTETPVLEAAALEAPLQQGPAAAGCSVEAATLIPVALTPIQTTPSVEDVVSIINSPSELAPAKATLPESAAAAAVDITIKSMEPAVTALAGELLIGEAQGPQTIANAAPLASTPAACEPASTNEMQLAPQASLQLQQEVAFVAVDAVTEPVVDVAYGSTPAATVEAVATAGASPVVAEEGALPAPVPCPSNPQEVAPPASAANSSDGQADKCSKGAKGRSKQHKPRGYELKRLKEKERKAAEAPTPTPTPQQQRVVGSLATTAHTSNKAAAQPVAATTSAQGKQGSAGKAQSVGQQQKVAAAEMRAAKLAAKEAAAAAAAELEKKRAMEAARRIKEQEQANLLPGSKGSKAGQQVHRTSAPLHPASSSSRAAGPPSVVRAAATTAATSGTSFKGACVTRGCSPMTPATRVQQRTTQQRAPNDPLQDPHHHHHHHQQQWVRAASSAPTYGSHVAAAGRIRCVGFPNLGNTCFAASGLQMLLRWPGLREWLEQLPNSVPANTSKEEGEAWDVAHNLRQVFRAWGAESSSENSGILATALEEFYQAFFATERVKTRQWVRQRQQDALEFVSLVQKILEVMSKDLFMDRCGVTIQQHDCCTRCRCVREVGGTPGSNVGSHLVLPIPVTAGDKDVTLPACLSASYGMERIDGSNAVNCAMCTINEARSTRCHQQHDKKMAMVQTPVERTTAIVTGQVLVMHVARFVGYDDTRRTNKVQVPRELDMGRWLAAGSSSADCKYELVAVVHHRGDSPNSGHYVAEAQAADGSWVWLDDGRVSLSCGRAPYEMESVARGASKSAYLALYQRVQH